MTPGLGRSRRILPLQVKSGSTENIASKVVVDGDRQTERQKVEPPSPQPRPSTPEEEPVGCHAAGRIDSSFRFLAEVGGGTRRES